MSEQKTVKKPALTGALALLPKSYEVVKRNFEVFMVLFSVGGLLALFDMLSRLDDGDEKQSSSLTDSAIGGLFGPSYDASFYAAAGGFLAILFALYIVTYLMTVIASVRGAQGHKLTLRAVWKEFSANWLWLKLIGAMLLSGLAIVAGLILLIIPGIILIWRLYLVPYIMVDQKTTISEAFIRSWEMTKGQMWPIYSIIFVTILLSLANIIPIIGGLIAFLLGAAYTVAPAIRYQELKK